MISLRPHQLEWADRAYKILSENAIVYNTSLERTGKTLSSIRLVELTTRQRCLVLTKKAAIPDWHTAIDGYAHGKEFQVTNYESIHKVEPGSFDIVILDEAHHALSKYPKPSKTFLKVAKLVYGLPLIYLSATPHAETFSQLYHQLRLSPWSPFAAYTNFYKWHKEYGVENIVYLAGRAMKQYNLTDEERIKPIFSKISLGVTRKEIGFEHEANDVRHTITLNPNTWELVNTISKDRVMEVQGYEVLAETVGSMLQKMYQIEGGTLKIEDGMINETTKKYVSVSLGNTEKIDYIKEHWGDSDDTVIMYNYKQEEILLRAHFQHALIRQADRFAEGVSYKDKEHLVIYSMSWRTSKYIQRRNRQADMERTTPIHVHYLLVADGISEKIYDAVVEKNENFNGRYYTENF